MTYKDHQHKKSKARKTGKRKKAPDYGTVVSASIEVGPPERGHGENGKGFCLTRTVVDKVEVFAFHRYCKKCSAATPDPDEETLMDAFDSGSCWIWPFDNWTPEGWVQVNDGDNTWHLCPECK